MSPPLSKYMYHALLFSGFNNNTTDGRLDWLQRKCMENNQGKNSKNTEARVIILVHDTSSYCAS